jgi:hypothetical protein
MKTFRVGARDSKGNKTIFEVSNCDTPEMARQFVITETKASAVLALVDPVRDTEIEQEAA